MFIWDRKTTNIARVLTGDESIVNCLQPHPFDCLLATSGIDPVVRLWAPKPEVSLDPATSMVDFIAREKRRHYLKIKASWIIYCLETLGRERCSSPLRAS